MRKKIVAGNWKMNKTCSDGPELVKSVLKGLESGNAASGADRIIFFPPYILIPEVSSLIQGHAGVSAGAQNCHTEEKGAYTGEISAAMIRSAGAAYVLVGHSERRSYFGEKSKLLSKKIRMALSAGLTPVYCIGETLDERNASRQQETVSLQLQEGLFHLSEEEILKTAIAYEPVWAIGTGVTATAEQAQEMHAFIRGLLSEKYSSSAAGEISVLYGGSCTAANASQLFSCPDVDGGLIGTASLKAGDFLAIIHSF